MTRQNTTRKPVRCPSCQAQISSLYYVAHKSVPGEFTLDAGHQEDICEDQDNIEYCCPECDADLFDDEAAAENFLLGKDVRPILMKKSRMEKVNRGE